MIHQKQHIVPSVMSLPQQLRLTLEVEMPLLENNVLQQVEKRGMQIAKNKQLSILHNRNLKISGATLY